jgi:hypothetical protein
MRVLSVASFQRRNRSIRIACLAYLLAGSIVLLGAKTPSNQAPLDPAELEALRVLNDSQWAHTIKPSLQETPCTYQNAAFPGLYEKGWAAEADARVSAVPDEVVRPDDSEYLIRFQSAKPVQTAIEQLLAMGQKRSAYGESKQEVNQAEGPTDVANVHYDAAGMITIAVIQKRQAPPGTSLFDYGFKDNGHIFPSKGFLVFPCAGLRTHNGQVHAYLGDPGSGVIFDPNGKPLQHGMLLSFPRIINGKPLISKSNEEVEFRFIVNQRVFETKFHINTSDVLDGSEKSIYLNWAFTNLDEVPER